MKQFGVRFINMNTSTRYCVYLLYFDFFLKFVLLQLYSYNIFIEIRVQMFDIE